MIFSSKIIFQDKNLARTLAILLSDHVENKKTVLLYCTYSNMVSGKSYDWPAEPNYLPDICIEQIHILYKRMEALTGTIPVRKVTSVSYGLEISN